MILNKILVFRTHIVINDYNLGDCNRVENCFSIYDPITHKTYFQGMEYIEEDKQLLLPRGVDIYFLENLFECKAIFVDNKIDKFDNHKINLKYMPRDDIQVEALKFMIGEGKYEINRSLPQLSLNLNTGKGKTYCSIATASYLGVKTMIITYSINVLNQWKKFILEYTDTRPEEICMMINSSKINRTIKNDVSKYKFILTSHGSLSSYAKTNGWNSITTVFEKLRIGIKIYDEAHLNFKSMCSIDFYTNTARTYYITATPMRSNEEENSIFQFYLKNVPSIDLFNAEEDPHTDYLAIKYNSHPSTDVMNECKNQYGLDRNKYVGYIVRNPNFYKVLHILMKRIINHGGKTLIYIGTIEGIEIVYNWIISNYPEFRYNTCILNSNVNDKSVIFKNQIILSTTKSAGAAIDITHLKRTIVLAEPFKSEVLARQSLGRTRNDNTEYIEIVDKGFRIIGSWFNYKKNIFRKYASSCKTISLSDKDLDMKYMEIINERMNMFNPPVYNYNKKMIKYPNKRMIKYI